jgi:hypothetical protein
MSKSGENYDFLKIFLLTFKNYVNHFKLCEMTNMKVEGFKLKNSLN